MSNKFITRVLTNSPAVGIERLVLVCIADRADESGLAWPGISDIARRARISERSAQRTIRSLEKRGELRVKRGAGRTTSRYWVLTSDTTVSPLSEQAAAKTVTTGHPCGDTAMSPQPRQRRRPSGDTALSPEPSCNHHSTLKEDAHAQRIEKTPLPANFQISDEVKAWAENKGFERLDVHLEAFKLKAAANGYEKSDWDAMLMRAISEDWAKVRKGAAARAPILLETTQRTIKQCTHCSQPLSGGYTSMRIGKVCNSCYDMYLLGKWHPDDNTQRIVESPQARAHGEPPG